MSTRTPLQNALHGQPAHFDGGLVDIAQGTCAWLQPNGSWGESNAGLVLGDGAAALVDTTWDLRLTRRMLDAVAARTELPIGTLILTHADGDHVHGAQLLPGAKVVCSAATAIDMTFENPAGLERIKMGSALLARVGLGQARRFGRYLTEMLAPFDFRGVRIRAPDLTFDDRLDLTVGGRLVALHRLGPAHTAGDVVVHLPDVQVVFVGDLWFHNVTPNSWSGSVTSWRRAIEAILALDPKVIVPGHGPIGDGEALGELDRYLAWLDRHAREHLAAGRSVDETAYRVVTSDSFLREPWARWESVERTVLNVVLIDRERRGVSTRIRHSERPRMMWKVAALEARLRGGGGR